ncbi:MAG: acetate--CoA ligase family protein [Desulfomicrobium escambiense]|nr:acetate--CoA ligase family protein [Desulfomicrobium escambiense]
MGRIGLEIEEVAEIDINPMIIHDDMPIAVDALVVLRNPKASQAECRCFQRTRSSWRPWWT